MPRGSGSGGADGSAAAVDEAADEVAFRGEHQAGIITPAQDRMHFVALDVVTKDRAALAEMLKAWTRAAERMTVGRRGGARRRRRWRPLPRPRGHR